MADYLPKFKPGEAISFIAGSGGVTGGLMVTAAGVTAGANATDWLGVASHDAAQGLKCGAYSGGVQYVVANGAISVGGTVKCAANGQVAPHVIGTDAAERKVGIALAAATNAGDVIPVKFDH